VAKTQVEREAEWQIGELLVSTSSLRMTTTVGVGARLAPLRAERSADRLDSLSAEFLGRYLAMELIWNKRRRLMKKRVEFDAHKIVKKRTEVEFTTKDGKDIDFMANKKAKVPVHVRFKANVK
jgi:hypothetical protein